MKYFKTMNFTSFVFCLSFCAAVHNYQRISVTVNQGASSAILRDQANKMGRAFVSGDYETFSHYTYPEIVELMGGEEKMAATLAKVTNDIKAKGMLGSFWQYEPGLTCGTGI